MRSVSLWFRGPERRDQDDASSDRPVARPVRRDLLEGREHTAPTARGDVDVENLGSSFSHGESLRHVLLVKIPARARFKWPDFPCSFKLNGQPRRGRHGSRSREKILSKNLLTSVHKSCIWRNAMGEIAPAGIRRAGFSFAAPTLGGHTRPSQREATETHH